MFLLFIYMKSGCGKCYEGGLHVHRPPVKWSAIAEHLRNAAMKGPVEDGNRQYEGEGIVFACEILVKNFADREG